MNVVYLIGNGFDIACGLNTSASSVISSYRKKLEEDISNLDDVDLIKRSGYSTFLKSINEDPDSWSDFEMKLGEITKRFETNENDDISFEAAFIHFRNYLRNHIEQEQLKIDELDFDENDSKKLTKALTSFLSSKMRRDQRESLKHFIDARRGEHWGFSLLVFNYTTIIDRLLSLASNPFEKITIGNALYRRTIDHIIHIHGSLQDDFGIIVGVDNLEQIQSEGLRKSTLLTDSLVKPNVNYGIGELRDRDSVERIKSADIIIIHGMSMGKSDATWWETIGEWLLSNPDKKLLILSVFDATIDRECHARPEAYSRASSSYKTQFLDLAQVPTEIRETIEPRILTVINESNLKPVTNSVSQKVNNSNNPDETS